MGDFDAIKPGARIRGLTPNGIAEIVFVAKFGSDAINVVFRADGKVQERLLYRGDAGPTFREAADVFVAEYKVITHGERNPQYVGRKSQHLRLYLLPFFGDRPLTEVTYASSTLPNPNAQSPRVHVRRCQLPWAKAALSSPSKPQVLRNVRAWLPGWYW